jgi:hypothetical protein
VAQLIQNKSFQLLREIVSIRSEEFVLRANQLVVWTTLQPRDRAVLSAQTVWLPAVLDTGFNGTYLIGEGQTDLLPDFSQFTPLPPTRIARQGTVQSIATLQAALWIRSEVPGSPDLRVPLNGGFLSWPENGRTVRQPVPLLGQTALSAAELELTVNYQLLRFSLKKAEPANLARFGERCGPAG